LSSIASMPAVQIYGRNRYRPRRRALEKVVPAGGVLLLSRRLSANRLEADKLAKRRGYEGLVAKDLSSPYVERRSRYWLKVKVHQENEFVIVGFTAPEGSRQHFGALRLGVYEGGTLRYPKLPGGPPIAGRSGTGHIWAEDGRPWLVAPNLTSDPETGAARWTDDMLARAIREGISHDGRMQHPQIWYTAFSSLSDEDLASVVVYIRSLMHTTALPGIFGCCCVSIGPWSITGAKC
jgi:hypothetical protein